MICLIIFKNRYLAQILTVFLFFFFKGKILKIRKKPNKPALKLISNAGQTKTN